MLAHGVAHLRHRRDHQREGRQGVKLESLLDPKELEQLAHDNLVGYQRHPTLPLRIYNYTQHAQYAQKWGGAIDFCRGLIVDDDNNIVARPFKKFHNLQTTNIPETWEENLPQTSPTITKKYDGSLGIYYWYGGYEGIATRGSFTSPQALWATNWYLKHRKIQHGDGYGMNIDWPIETTTLFEIIYPENRIVVKYDFEGLVVLGMVDNEKGFEWDYKSVASHAEFNNFLMAEKLDDIALAQLKEANIENEEGYVLTYLKRDAPPLKVKVKMADYLRLHKIVTGMNARSVWELLSSGQGIGGFEHTPEHFQKWLNSWSNKLNQEFQDILVTAQDIWTHRPDRLELENEKMYRAAFARYVISHNMRFINGVLFAMFDGKDTAPIIWKSIKPRGDETTFRTEGE
jgi:hypothetical protein